MDWATNERTSDGDDGRPRAPHEKQGWIKDQTDPEDYERIIAYTSSNIVSDPPNGRLNKHLFLVQSGCHTQISRHSGTIMGLDTPTSKARADVYMVCQSYNPYTTADRRTPVELEWHRRPDEKTQCIPISELLPSI